MDNERRLCHRDELPDQGARGLLREGRHDRVFAVRRDDEVFVWLNDCPHNHRPLEYQRDRFLSADGQHIVCYAHSAHFELRSGLCFAGPCVGRYLTEVPSRVDAAGVVWIAAELPLPKHESPLSF